MSMSETEQIKHIFVVNPTAGGRNCFNAVQDMLQRVDIDHLVYCTQDAHDATTFVSSMCSKHPDVRLRFYACGGDGTLNEVVSGLVDTSAEVTCIPFGSGNDYIKCWPNRDFTSLESLVAGTPQSVDLMKVNDRYCINVCNFGFEAEVCRTMQHVRRMPLIGGPMAYYTGIAHSLLYAMHTQCSIEVDGQKWREGDMLLGSAACGQYVGGGFRCAPRAIVDDGWLEVQSVDSMHLPRFLQVIGHYRAGRHLDMPELSDIIHYTRARRVKIMSEHDLSVVIDGELLRNNEFNIECLPSKIKFVTPINK